jgi:hypothetical protein
MPYRHVITIKDDVFNQLEHKIHRLCVKEGFKIPPNLTHIALTEVFNEYVAKLVETDELFEFICDWGGLDDLLLKQ